MLQLVLGIALGVVFKEQVLYLLDQVKVILS